MGVKESDTVTILERGDTTYYLVGTAHVSRDSVDEVRRIIEEVRPDTVCVELCEPRYNALTSESAWKNLDVFKVIREGKTLFLLGNLAIGAYQRRMGAELGVKPGSELLEAIEKAREIGAEVVLIDRDINITLKRTWGNLGFWKKTSLLGAIVQAVFSRGEKIDAQEIEKLKEQAHLSEMLLEFAEQLPEVKGPLIDERDQYLMSGAEAAPGKNIVVVVGAAHVPGMKANFGKDVDRDALDRLPTPSRAWGLLKWVIPALILGAFAFGYFRQDGWTTLEDMLIAWVLPNSVFAALFTIVGGGKPLSVLAAFVASPITSLNPLLPVGVIVGLTEAYLRKPTVEDCERINDDVQSLRGAYKNKVTRVLIVAFLSILGSALGAWIGLGWVMAIL